MLSLEKQALSNFVTITDSQLANTFNITLPVSSLNIVTYEPENLICLVGFDKIHSLGIIYHPTGFNFNGQLQTASSFQDLVNLLQQLLS